jgi:MscS family membrane protein
MIEQHLPAWLRGAGPFGLAWWQWLAVPAVALLAAALGTLLGWVTRRLLGRIAARTRVTWDDRMLGRLGGPLTLLWSLGVGAAAQPVLDLDAGAAAVVQRALRSVGTLAIFWAALRAADVAFESATRAPRTRENPALAGFLPLGRQVARVVLAALGAIAILNELGFQVTSILAGLGIGGIAVALAAQKTVENLFGSFAIGVDQPFRVGDFVRVGDVLGTVESIGMRSTRVRTLDRTLVTFPNGKLADMQAETFGARDRCRLVAQVGLVYSTTAGQLRRVLAGFEAALRAHPRIWPDTVSVRFVRLGESSLDVEVMAWFLTSDWNEFTAIRQEMLLRFVEVVEEAGSSFAFPTRTLVMKREEDPEEAEKASARR